MGAFGKNDDDKKRINPFNFQESRRRQQAMNQAFEERKAKKTGSGGGGGRYSDIFKPSLAEYDTIRIIPGEYEVRVGRQNGSIDTMFLEYYPYIEHYHATLKRSSICSGGPLHDIRKHREPCVACDMFYQAKEIDPDTGKPRRSAISKRPMIVFTVLHNLPHHKVPSIDKRTGQVRRNEETGQQYYEWAPCSGRQCQMCKNGDEKIPAHRKHWPMGTTHFNMLTNEFANKISESCANCGGKKTIRTSAWVCRNKRCADPVIEPETSTLSKDEIARITSNPVRCSACGTEDYLEEMIECTNNCDAPRRATIFDADIEVKRSPSGNENQTVLVVGDYTIQPLDPVFVKYAQPMDLPRLYAPTPLEVQERVYESRDQSNGGRGGSMPYSRSR